MTDTIENFLFGDNETESQSQTSAQTEPVQTEQAQSQTESISTPQVQTPSLPSTKEFFGNDFEIEDWDKVKTELPSWKAKAKEAEQLRQQLEEVVNPFVDEDVALFNEFAKQTKIKDYNAFQSFKGLDLSSADPVEMMVVDMVIQNPALRGKEDVLKARILNDNGLNEQEVSPEEVEVNKALFEKKIEPVRERLQSIKNSLTTKSVKPEDLAQKKQEFVAEITPQVQAIAQTLNKLPIEVKPKEGEVLANYDFEVPAEKLSAYTQSVVKSLASMGVKVTDKNKNDVAQFIKNQAILDNFDTIVHSIYSNARTELAKQMDIKLDNPSFIKPKEDMRTASAVDIEKQMVDEMFS